MVFFKSGILLILYKSEIYFNIINFRQDLKSIWNTMCDFENGLTIMLL